MPKSFARLVPSAVAILIAPAALATIRYVDDSAPAGGNGLSWASPLRHLNEALTASVAGDTVRVAGGTYWPDTSTAFPGGSNNRATSFVVVSGVKLIGGYAGYGAPDPNLRDLSTYATILSGDLLQNDGLGLTADNTYHIIRTTGPASALTTIDGFIIAWGNADSGSPFGGGGGGIRVSGGTPTIVNCLFSANSGTTGGAIRVDAPLANGAIGGCTFVGNSAGGGGGAIDFQVTTPTTIVNGCYFDGNKCTDYHGGTIIVRQPSGPVDFKLLNSFILNSETAVAGAVTTWMGVHPTVSDCVFSGNSSPIAAAALNTFSTPVKLIRCVFKDNAGGSSGAIAMFKNDAQTLLNRVASTRFWNNSCTFLGGAGMMPAQTTFVNCIVAQNFAYSPTSTAGGLDCEHATDIRHCTFTENGPNAGGSYDGSKMYNSIVWGNTVSQWAAGPGGLAVDHCIIENGWPGGNYVFLGDPQFVAPDAQDLRLSSTSTGVNTGLASLMPADFTDLDQDGNLVEIVPLDIDGAARLQGPAPDLGAHEGATSYVPPAEGAQDIGPGETAIIGSNGGTPSATTIGATVTNLDGPADGVATITEIGWDPHPGAGGFSEDALINGFVTTIPIGSHHTQIRVPFNLFTLYPHGDLAGMRATLYDAALGAWRLGVSKNHAPAVNGGGGAIGQYHLIYATPGVPTAPPTTHGDFGTVWDPQALKGYVFANVDVAGEFGVGRSTCAADVGPAEGDGIVDGFDVGAVLTNWGTTGAGNPFDIDGNGVVNGADLALVLAAWGGCGAGGGLAGDDALPPAGPSAAWLELAAGATHGAPKRALPKGFDPARADFNGDGRVNGGDLGLLLAAWGDVSEPLAAAMDLDGDGRVDGADLGMLLASWR
ncbi:MAG: dockerin type I domain-containing protein [Phycisphaerales bacterium]